MHYALLILLVMLLAGCGGSRESRAAEACEKAIASRITDKPFRVDRSDMVDKAVSEGNDIVRIQSSIVFDPGLPREETQQFDCRARFSDDRREPDVISLSFVW
jgi:hypothetical protein